MYEYKSGPDTLVIALLWRSDLRGKRDRLHHDWSVPGSSHETPSPREPGRMLNGRFVPLLTDHTSGGHLELHWGNAPPIRLGPVTV